MKRSTVAGFAALFVAILAGCAHHVTTTTEVAPGPGAGPDGTGAGTTLAADGGVNTTFAMVRSCTKTGCEAKAEAGTESEACSQCWASAQAAMQDAGYSDALVNQCNAVCESTPDCTAADNAACADGDFTANVTAASDPSLYAACAAYFGVDSGDASVPATEIVDEKAFCAAWAKTERPEMTAYFTCAAASGGTGCPTPPATTLGDELCGGLTAACGQVEANKYFSCATNRDSWNETGGELRDDAAKAGLTCLAYNCDDMKRCLTTWQHAIQHGDAN